MNYYLVKKNQNKNIRSRIYKIKYTIIWWNLLQEDNIRKLADAVNDIFKNILLDYPRLIIGELKNTSNKLIKITCVIKKSFRQYFL